MRKQQLTFGVIVGTRGFFSPELARQGKAQLLAQLERLGHRAILLPAEATPTGAVETTADARKCADLFNQHRSEMDGVIVSLPNFGDELGIVNTLHFARLGVPVLVQACDDELDKLDTLHRRDSFCGKLSVCNNLYQYGIPFTGTATHIAPIAEIDHRLVGDGEVGPITGKIQALYFDVIQGKNPRYMHWCTPVY